MYIRINNTWPKSMLRETRSVIPGLGLNNKICPKILEIKFVE